MSNRGTQTRQNDIVEYRLIDAPVRVNVMPYSFEIKIVEYAIADLQSTLGDAIKTKLESEQAAAGTSLELYGITKSFLEKLLADYRLSGFVRASALDAIRAIEVIYGSRNALLFRFTAIPRHFFRQRQRANRLKVDRIEVR